MSAMCETDERVCNQAVARVSSRGYLHRPGLNVENLFISILIFVTICSVVGVLIGVEVDKGPAGFWLGFFLGPIGWIIVLLLPRDSDSNPSEENKTPTIQAPETRDLTDDAYKLYLAKKYSIERNDIFEKFVCDNKMFDSMDSALSYADSLETISLEKKERLKREQEAEVERKQKETEARLESDSNMSQFFFFGLLLLFAALFAFFLVNMAFNELKAANDAEDTSYKLGLALERGKDYEEAVAQYIKAAEKGNALAQSKLALMYFNGRGGPKNLVYAHMWWEIASSGGHKSASRNRDSVAKTLTANQLAEAKRLARECVKKEYKNC